MKFRVQFSRDGYRQNLCHEIRIIGSLVEARFQGKTALIENWKIFLTPNEPVLLFFFSISSEKKSCKLLFSKFFIFWWRRCRILISPLPPLPTFSINEILMGFYFYRWLLLTDSPLFFFFFFFFGRYQVNPK